MNENIQKLIYDLKYADALELIEQELEQEEVKVCLDLLSYFCVCSYIAKGICVKQLEALATFVMSDSFDRNKVKKNTKTLVWVFDTINDYIHDNTLILHEPIDGVLSGLLTFKQALPTSINISVAINKFKSYLFNAKKELESRDAEKTEEVTEEKPRKSISPGIKASSKLLQLFKKIELCMELSNQSRLFEASLFYKDIQEEITNFDPIAYFPEVFIPFYRNLSKSYVKIQKFIDKSQDTLEWHLAEQMYKSSPEALVAGGEIYQIEELESTHEVSNFIREHQSILPNMGVIDDKSYSRILDNNIAGGNEVSQNKNAVLDRQDVDHAVSAEGHDHERVDSKVSQQVGRDRLDEIIDEHEFDFDFD
ncbi:type VI secretion system protein IglI family protein [Piscirickettsia salmonis]|uniref:type VI secretion system protein IglI family protein n=1 Tax=Piscirickettsia salmonis TaxID=1238 RepID=UPI003EBA578D